MRTALTIALTGSGSAILLAGPEVSLNCQKAALKHRSYPGTFAEVQLWESGHGLSRRVRNYAAPVLVPVHADPAPVAPTPDVRGKLESMSTEELVELGGVGGLVWPEGTARESIITDILREGGAPAPVTPEPKKKR